MSPGGAEFARELAVALEAARAAGAVVRRHYGRADLGVATKADDSPVTRADTEANELIVGLLRGACPADAILSEEAPDDAARLQAARVWLVDPLDGTRDFVARTGDFAVHVGLAVAGRPVVGVVYAPVSGLAFHAVVGQGAWVRGDGAPTRLHASRVATLAHARVGVSRLARDARLEAFAAHLGPRAVTQGASLKFMALARGELDAVVCLNDREREWDTGAPEVIMHEAGCRLTDGDGHPFAYNRPDVRHLRGSLASNGLLHAELAALARPWLP